MAKLFNLSYNSDNMDTIAAQLLELGLGDYEAKIYRILLTDSPASASLLAKKCNLARSSVYTTLSSLIAKGLIGTTYKNEVKQFIVEDISALEHLARKGRDEAEKRVKLAESMRDSFSALTSKTAQLPEIIHFEGQEGLKKIYLSMMRQAPVNSVRYLLRDGFIWQPQWKFAFEKDWHDRVERIKKEKHMSTKLLVNDSKEEKSKEKIYKNQKDFSYRFLPTKHSVKQFAMYIIGDTTAVMSMEDNNLIGLKITNAHLTENFKQIFEGLWKSSR